ncbi:MAG TPA: creatininase family protein [Beijerinckiaceae bacterium]|nr:creatininase family protein [Beijerinckiaceae bacterium]
MAEVLWNRLTAAELVALAKKDAIVLLPVASTEQHGPHLATGVDTFLAGEGCRRTALLVQRKRPIVVAPTVWIGLAEHHMAFGGSFTLSLPTYHALLREICRSILRAGFRKILIVNGHGGNMAALGALTTDLAMELGAPIATTTLYALPTAAGAYEGILEDQKGVQHACEAETSMMMAAFPDCVRKNKLKAAVGPKSDDAPFRSAVAVWTSFKELTPSGVFGDGRRATPEKGEKLLDIAAQLLAQHLLTGKPWA